MQINDLTSQSFFTELSENEMNNINGGRYSWHTFKRQVGHVEEKAEHAASDIANGAKDALGDVKPGTGTFAYNLGYIGGALFHTVRL